MASIPPEPVGFGLLTSPTLPELPSGHVNIYALPPADLANYFIKLITRNWIGTLVKLDLRHIPTDVGHLSTPDQLVIYNPRKDCLYKLRVDQVPEEVVQNLEKLAHAQDFGVGCFKQLYEVLKKRVHDTTMFEHSEENYGKGVKGAIAMLVELSLQVSSPDEPDQSLIIGPKDVKVYVVLVDDLGESHRYTHLLHTDTDFNTFLEDMDRAFSKFCDPYNDWAYKNWGLRIQDLKNTGVDRDPTLARIEELIVLHQATKNEEAPQWMYYTIRSNGAGGEEIDIRDEASLRAVISMAADQKAPACLMRLAEAKFRNILVELRFLEERRLALGHGQDRAQIKDKDGAQNKLVQHTGEIMGDDDDSPFDPGSCYSLNYFYNLDKDHQEHFENQRDHDDN